jgi:hypothetical protein
MLALANVTNSAPIILFDLSNPKKCILLYKIVVVTRELGIPKSDHRITDNKQKGFSSFYRIKSYQIRTHLHIVVNISVIVEEEAGPSLALGLYPPSILRRRFILEIAHLSDMVTKFFSCYA